MCDYKDEFLGVVCFNYIMLVYGFREGGRKDLEEYGLKEYY